MKMDTLIRWRPWRTGLCLALLCLALVACGDEEPAASSPAAEPAAVTATSTEAAGETTSPAPQAAEPQTDTQAVAAQTPAQAPASPLLTPTPVSQAAAASSPVVTATVSANGTVAVFAPLEVEEGTGCAIESHLDLVGYPNLEERMGCPVAEAILDDVAINEFGAAQPPDRFMLWFSHEQRIYTLLPDGTYISFDDTWVEGEDPTYSCNPTNEEPDSPPLPRRGFGKIWCENPQIQAVMGLVPREERLCQHSVLQAFTKGRLLACFEDATIRYFRLLNNGTWNVEIQ